MLRVDGCGRSRREKGFASPGEPSTNVKLAAVPLHHVERLDVEMGPNLGETVSLEQFLRASFNVDALGKRDSHHGERLRPLRVEHRGVRCSGGAEKPPRKGLDGEVRWSASLLLEPVEQ